MSVLTTSTPMIGTRKETVEAVEAVGTAEAVKTAEVGEEREKSKGEYLNLA